MERFIHQANLEIYRKQLLYVVDETKRRQLLRLLAEEEAKDDASYLPKAADKSTQAAAI